MDELIIDDKRYISSKQAAKVTGYAKDYIGQLCREGRVPAQVVGRSWYVLESAIRDHRFGNDEHGTTEHIEEKPSFSVTSSWQNPRYEAAIPQVLPQVQRIQQEERPEIDLSEPAEEIQTSTEPHGSWVSNDISQIEDSHEATEHYEEEVDAQEVHAEPVSEAVLSEPDDSEQQRELTATSMPLVRKGELQTRIAATSPRPTTQRRSTSKPIAYALIRVAAPAVALIVLGITALNTGYFDDYLISASRASAITGYSVYEK